MRHWALRKAAATSLLLTGLGAASCGAPEAPPPQEPTETPVPTVPAAARPTFIVRRGDVQEVLRFSGRWLPSDQVQLSFPIDGTVRQVNVQRGDSVRAGQLLADYQITALEDQLATANLQLQTAKSILESGAAGATGSVADAEIALADARLNLDAIRLGSPWPDVALARADLDAAAREVDSAQRAYDDAISRPNYPALTIEAAFDRLAAAKEAVRAAQAAYQRAAVAYAQYQPTINSAENQVIAAQLALDRARSGAADPQLVQAVTAAQLTVDQLQASIRQSSLFAPIDGEVLDVFIRPGDQIAAFSVVMTMGIPEPKEAVATLAFADAQRLSVGLIGLCQEINRPETMVQCIVRRIPLDTREADQTTRVAASLEAVATGQLIEITMPLQVRADVLWLPPAAIRTFQNRIYIVIQTPDGQRVVDVEIGLRTPDRVEIRSGVAEGDVVVGP